jgi:hypothetical protein
MGAFAAIIGCIGTLTMILGVLSIMQIPAEPIISAKLTWHFWFGLSALLYLASMVLLTGRNSDGGD